MQCNRVPFSTGFNMQEVSCQIMSRLWGDSLRLCCVVVICEDEYASRFNMYISTCTNCPQSLELPSTWTHVLLRPKKLSHDTIFALSMFYGHLYRESQKNIKFTGRGRAPRYQKTGGEAKRLYLYTSNLIQSLQSHQSEKRKLSECCLTVEEMHQS